MRHRVYKTDELLIHRERKKCTISKISLQESFGLTLEFQISWRREVQKLPFPSQYLCDWLTISLQEPRYSFQWEMWKKARFSSLSLIYVSQHVCVVFLYMFCLLVYISVCLFARPTTYLLIRLSTTLTHRQSFGFGYQIWGMVTVLPQHFFEFRVSSLPSILLSCLSTVSLFFRSLRFSVGQSFYLAICQPMLLTVSRPDWLSLYLMGPRVTDLLLKIIES